MNDSLTPREMLEKLVSFNTVSSRSNLELIGFVRDYLASHGVNPQRMRTISYGKERPVAVCNDISCWSQNRRAVTVLNTSS